MSTSVPPDTDSWHEAVTHGFYGERTDPYPDSIYVPGIQADVAPTVTSIIPPNGPEAGGYQLTVMGTNLYASTVVLIGGATAETVDTLPGGDGVVVTCPPGVVGAVDVVVTTPGGTVTVEGGFTYDPPPEPAAVTGVTPSSGLAGSEIVVAGTGLATGWAVRVGTQDGAVTGATDTSVTATTPATGTGGPHSVTVYTENGNPSIAEGFTYTTAEDAPPEE